MDISSFLPIAESIAGGAIGAGALKGPLKSLDDWWYYFFGSKTELTRQKAELLNAQKLEAYKSNIYEEVKNIPPENVKEPKLDIIGPALEASKYYIDAPELRKMFAKLVASSIDSRKEATTRSAFVEFVKQMSPLDARFLSILTTSKFQNKLPICKINKTLKGGSNIPMESGVLALEVLPDLKERKLAPAAINNLSRMGLVQISYSEWLHSFNYDKHFTQTPEYARSVQEQTLLKEEFNIVQNFKIPDTAPSDQKIRFNQLQNKVSTVLEQSSGILESNITIEKGLISITALGTDFTSICV